MYLCTVKTADVKEITSLPAYQIAGEVNRALTEGNRLIITAPPGAGKSTVLPLTILEGLSGNGKLLMLEPRRVAARQIAERMAWLVGEPVGRTIGYRVKQDTKVSRDTRIEVITEGILTRMLIEDPTLDGVAAVIFDEFHERSIHSDEALALTRQSQALLREDLRIIIMSATIDTEALATELQAPVIESEGRMFPVEIKHTAKEATPETVSELVAHYIREAHKTEAGDILAFLPGEGEIRRCEELLGQALGATHICPLYGMLSNAEQKAAIAPSAPGERKVVLATPVAETSLTIEGVRIVIDGGLYKHLVVDARSGLSHLETARISLDMATQRSGRAGRVAPGVCYRLWSAATEARMPLVRTPEILHADLAPLVLDIAAWGENDPMALPWLTPPASARITEARKLLQALGAMDGAGSITTIGKKMAALPCHPRLARMQLRADTPAMKALAARLSDLLEERNPRLEALRANPYEVGVLLASAYPERIGKAWKSGEYLLACGERVALEADAAIAGEEWIAVASMSARPGGVGKVFVAAPLAAEDLSAFTTERDVVLWDKDAAVARREKRIGNLLVESRPLSEGVREQLVQVIVETTRKEGTSLFDFNEDVENLQRRVASVAAWRPSLELPDLSTEEVLRRADEWVPLYIGKATSVSQLKKIDLCSVLWGMLSYDEQQAVERFAPSHITVPTGSHIRLEYRQGADAPVLRVRLQECFGLTDTPRVDDGRRPVLMELLSPGYKPVQLTSDLASFWCGTYFEVRKELRRRYPKHYWPDNPLDAEPVRGVKKKA